MDATRARLDLGRIVMVPVAAIMLLLDLAAATRRGGPPLLWWPGTTLSCSFYSLIIWCYLRRGPAVATSGSVTGYAAAAAATLTPFVLPLLRGAAPGAGQDFAADALMLAGTAWAVWSLRFLGRSLSVIAQARQVVDRGPYRWVRHPLYTGEIASALGLAITAGSPWAFAAWLAFCALQAYRALREEQILLRALPGYRSYRARTGALFPVRRRGRLG
jgi:protein-S-isoprenylcysteine O-methyltransferase Ste14